MKSVGTVFPTMLKRKEWKGECGKALCSDSALWHWNGEKIAWKFWGGQGEGPLPWKGVKWGLPPRGSCLRGSDQGCETPPGAAPRRSRVSQHCSCPNTQQRSWEIIHIWGIGDPWSYANSLQTFHVRLWPHITHSFFKSNLLGFYHSRSITVLSNYQNPTSEKASICLPSYFNLLSSAITPSGYWLEFCFVLSPCVIQGDTELAEYIRSLYAS